MIILRFLRYEELYTSPTQASLAETANAIRQAVVRTTAVNGIENNCKKTMGHCERIREFLSWETRSDIKCIWAHRFQSSRPAVTWLTRACSLPPIRPSTRCHFPGSVGSPVISHDGVPY